MKFKSTTIHGKGRGKDLGFPTINMTVPDTLPVLLPQGVYAGKAMIGEEEYYGALYYGPAVVFGETDISLEIHLLNTVQFHIGEHEEVEIEVGKYIRPVMNFDMPEQLSFQIAKDEEEIRKHYQLN